MCRARRGSVQAIHAALQLGQEVGGRRHARRRLLHTVQRGQQEVGARAQWAHAAARFAHPATLSDCSAGGLGLGRGMPQRSPPILPPSHAFTPSVAKPLYHNTLRCNSMRFCLLPGSGFGSCGMQ